MSHTKLTRKQERFSELYVETGNASEAYRRAYDAGRMKSATVNRNAAGLLKNNKIATRIAALEAEKARLTGTVAERLEISIERTLQEMARLAYANMMDYIGVTDGGYAYVDLSKLSRAQAAAIQEVVVDEYTEGRGEDARPVKRTRFKLADKQRSLGELLKYLTDAEADKNAGAGAKDQATDTPRPPDNDHLSDLGSRFLSQSAPTPTAPGTDARH